MNTVEQPTIQKKSLKQRCQSIRLFVMDVDGVLTGGGIIHNGSGVEWKVFNVRDGMAIKALGEAGIRTAIITGRESSVVELRAKELGVSLVVQGSKDKMKSLQGIWTATGENAPSTCFMGDDLADLGPIQACGLGVAPGDGSWEVRQAAHYVTQAPAGRCGVREIAELILQVQGKWALVGV
ncbi:MAG: phenylphosphate carboxylase subunit delta [Gemmataceae bacterium]|nr:phenylphosphate carboxylase subunit delta [Gemmataceae bacterium]